MEHSFKLPATRQGCHDVIARLNDDVISIQNQLAAADIARQGRRAQWDPDWFHRAKTALRHKKREIRTVTAHLSRLPRPTKSFRDHLLEVLREDYDDSAWATVMEEAHRRHGVV